MKIELLTRQSIHILTYLLEHPGKQKFDVQTDLDLDPHGTQKAFKTLHTEGYIEETSSDTSRYKRWRLTSSGEYLAHLLKEILEEKGIFKDFLNLEENKE